MAPEFGIGDWLWMIASFMLVICLMVATLFMIKRMAPGIQGASGKRLSISEVQHIGARQKLFLIQLNGDEILVGQSAQGMTLLGTWSRQEVRLDQPDADSESLESDGPSGRGQSSSFQTFLNQLVNRQKDK